MSKRVKYPNRTVYFRVQMGLLDVEANAERVEHDRLERLRVYGFTNDGLRMTTIEDFKSEFGICCETS